MHMIKRAFISFILLLVVAVGCQTTVTPEPTDRPEPTATITEATAVAPTIAVVEATEPPPTVTAAATDEPEPTTVSTTTNAANADVVYVKATETAVSTWTFAVSVDHPDTGWEDYADGWDVLLPDGTVLKSADAPFTRLLLHPHEGERPFTRSQSNIAIPADVTTVTVRAHDLVDGFGGKEVVVELTAVTGDNFEVQRLDPQ